MGYECVHILHGIIVLAIAYCCILLLAGQKLVSQTTTEAEEGEGEGEGARAAGVRVDPAHVLALGAAVSRTLVEEEEALGKVPVAQ